MIRECPVGMAEDHMVIKTRDGREAQEDMVMAPGVDMEVVHKVMVEIREADGQQAGLMAVKTVDGQVVGACQPVMKINIADGREVDLMTRDHKVIRTRVKEDPVVQVPAEIQEEAVPESVQELQPAIVTNREATNILKEEKQPHSKTGAGNDNRQVA
jgi:hypothetical protein